MSVFKAYDIRGTYPDQIDEKLARRIGAALAKFLGARSLVVGRDMRDCAPSIQKAIIDGIVGQGCDVIDIGMVSTPMTYYGIGAVGADGGLAVTASHNPAGYIGAKLCRKGAVPISADDGIKDLEQMVKEEIPDVAQKGSVKELDLAEEYRGHVQSFAQADTWSDLKVVIDTANGMGGLEVPLVLEGLGLNWEGLYLDLDGTFPNHEANPLKDENLADLTKAVLASGATLGCSFDGDADRCCVVDERGNRVGSDIITALLAREFLGREPGAAIIYDLRSTRALKEDILAGGGKPVEERVGHSFIKATMRQENCPFAGELSGHFYFRDHYFSDCATLAMISLLNLLGRERKSLSELAAPLLRYHSTGEVNFRVADPDELIGELRSKYGDADQSDLDGITVSYPEWWFNVRKSNTEPLLRLRLEAESAELLAAKNAEMRALLGTPAD